MQESFDSKNVTLISKVIKLLMAESLRFKIEIPKISTSSKPIMNLAVKLPPKTLLAKSLTLKKNMEKHKRNSEGEKISRKKSLAAKSPTVRKNLKGLRQKACNLKFWRKNFNSKNLLKRSLFPKSSTAENLPVKRSAKTVSPAQRKAANRLATMSLWMKHPTKKPCLIILLTKCLTNKNYRAKISLSKF